MLTAILGACVAAAPARAQGDRYFVIEGHGYGHGVGMGQYGAEGFAAHGLDYRQVLAHYYPGTKLAQVPEDAHVRVLLRSAASVVIASVDELRILDGAGRAITLAPGRYVFDGTMVVHAGGRTLAPRAPVRIEPTISPITLDGAAYRGAIVLRPDGAGGLAVVNDVAIDDYVRGVIAWEMPAGWHQEALRAQAVAARSYALASLTPSRSFDVYPDQRSQMYGGLRAERAGANHAVLTTLRQVLVWDGRVASTYFSSSSGGRTADARDVWSRSSRVPYLVSVPDPYDSRSPQHHWGPYLMSATTLASRLGVASITDIRTVDDSSGRVAYVSVRSASGNARISGGSAARALGLRSTWFTIRARGAARAATASARPVRVAPRTPPSARPEAPAPPVTTAQQPWRLPILAAGAFALLALASSRRRVVGRVLAAGAVAAAASAVTLFLSDGDGLVTEASGPRTEAGAHAVRRASHGRPQLPTLAETAEPSLPRVTGRPVLSGDLEWQTSSTPALPPAPPRVAPQRPEAVPAATTVPPAWTTAAEQPARPPAPLEIDDAVVRSLTASSVVVDWRTNLPAVSQGASGLGLSPRIWGPPEPSTTAHETTLSGLGGSTSYRVWLFAQDEYGQTASKELLLTTSTADADDVVQARGDSITVDTQPTFPVMLWATCADQVGPKLALGIDVFMGNGCGSDADLVRALESRALAIVAHGQEPASARGILGSYFPDEWDASLPSSISRDQLVPAAQSDTGLSFLTLTNHFYSRASALPQGKGMYPTLMSISDVVGFDLYPLQTWCRPAFSDVFDAQAELQVASGGKPTFQWIEVAAMEHRCNAFRELDPTAETIRAETWLAVAGGADGVGYFPNNWAPELDAGIAQTNWQLRELAPALLAADAQATSPTEGLRVSARTLNGALYVIAVNTTTHNVSAEIDVPGLAGRTSDVLGESRSLQPGGDLIHDDFPPLAVHVYLAPPAPWADAAVAIPAESTADETGSDDAEPILRGF